MCGVGTGGSPLDVDLHAGLLQQEQAAEALQVPPGCGLAGGRAQVAVMQRLQRRLLRCKRCSGLCSSFFSGPAVTNRTCCSMNASDG